METRSRAKSKSKRQRAYDDSDQRKSQRLASSAETELTTKIIDLNDDCLVKVFGYLDLQCLFNVAIANEWLRPAAQNVYTRKFGTKRIYISGCDDFRRTSARNKQSKASVLNCNIQYEEIDIDIDISGLKTCLLFLRCFGPAITDLFINYKHSESKRYNHVHQYINDYCAATLTRILFLQMPNIAIEQFQKAFVRVEDVDIWDCLLGVQWSNTFVECFPNVRRLQIGEVNIKHGVKIKKSFQYLEHLEIIGCNENITKQLATDLLQGAHRLNSLEIKSIDEENPNEPIAVLLDMTKMHPQITKLTYSFRSYRHILVNSVDVQRIIAEHAALIELRLDYYQFDVEDVFTLIGQFNSLKHFRFQVNGLEYAKFVAQLDRSKWEITAESRVYYGQAMAKYVSITLARKNVE